MSDVDRDQQIIEMLARKLAESVGESYTESPRKWQTIACVALNEFGGVEPACARDVNAET
jgi:hypothetical protein